MISRELLSEVLGKDIREIAFTEDEKVKLEENWQGEIFKENCLVYTYMVSMRGMGGSLYLEEINIHELSHKCKEWARDMDYILVSNLNTVGARCDVYSGSDMVMSTDSDTEPQAIFKACQWILDNKN